VKTVFPDSSDPVIGLVGKIGEIRGEEIQEMCFFFLLIKVDRFI
jgi:hypothetical protein